MPIWWNKLLGKPPTKKEQGFEEQEEEYSRAMEAARKAELAEEEAAEATSSRGARRQ